MIRQCLIIFGCLAIGELMVWLTGITIPSSILGMLLLAALLEMRLIKLEWVKGMADFLISNMGFFFVPPGVALMLYLDLIKAELVPIVVATVVSTVLVLIVTGWTHQLFKRHGDSAE
jgi:holin-like protein